MRGMDLAVVVTAAAGWGLIACAAPGSGNGGGGSICLTAPDFPGRLEAIQARGGRLVVVDPRRTKTAELADEHLVIRPGGDAAWLAALANVILTEGLVDLGDAAAHLDGVDALGPALAPFTPVTLSASAAIAAASTVTLIVAVAQLPGFSVSQIW